MFKIIKLSMGLWVAVLIVSLMTGCSGLNEKIHKRIETEGSELTGVKVGVEAVDIKIGEGMGQITGVAVANPEGYVTDNAFEMDLLRLNLGTLSVLTGSRPLIIDELVIDTPVVNLEMNPQGGSNLKEIRENINKNLEKAERKSREKKTAPSVGEPKDKPRRIAVSRLVIEGANFNLRRVDGSTHSGTLPDIELTDVGGSEGKTLGGIGTVVVVAMTKEILKEALAHKLLESVAKLQSQESGDGLEVFVAEKVLGILDQRLNLTPSQHDILEVVILWAMKELHTAVIEGGGLGLLEHGSLTSQLGAIAKATEMKLRDDLSEEQVAEIRAFFAKLAEDVAETIREALFERLATFLDLSPEQAEQFRPVFREELEKWSVLLSRFVNTFRTFANDFETLKMETGQKLEDLLNENQMKALAERQGALGEMIRFVLSPEKRD